MVPAGTKKYMMPPTALTLLVHTLTIGIKKIGVLLKVHYKSVPTKKQSFFSLTASLIIILIIGCYVSWVVFSFIRTAVTDTHATWRLADRSLQHVNKTLTDKKITFSTLIIYIKSAIPPPVSQKNIPLRRELEDTKYVVPAEVLFLVSNMKFVPQFSTTACYPNTQSN